VSDPRPTADDLERLLLGAPKRYTREDVAAAVGVPVEEARAYWRSLGFPDVGEAVWFTDADVEALRTVVALVDGGAIDRSTAGQMVRALGRMTGRLAEWHVETLVTLVEAAGRGPGGRLSSAYRLAERLLPDFERLLVYAWRRKLAASAGRIVAIGDVGPSGLLSAPASVGFADMVSFTRLSSGLTEHDLGALVESFEATTNDVIAAGGGRMVKTLGDEVLFVADDAAVAAAIACDLVAAIGEDPGVPDIRVGIATGPVVARLGDVFGTPANLAARLTALAGPNDVLVDGETAAELTDDRRFALRALPPRDIRGLGPVTPYAVSRRRPAFAGRPAVRD
jgi:adenylate cyclase